MALPSTPRVERFNTVVIGAGQAGLSVAHRLSQRDVAFVVLTADARIGDNWRRRWDSLRLFTPAERSGLPGMPFPAPPAHFPDKDEVADYLERYAERFELPVRTSTAVSSVTRVGGHYVVRTSTGILEAENVVVATGAFQKPKLPNVSVRLSPTIHQLHSVQYQNPLALPDGPVLVVGAGNSGAQIALELASVRKVWLAGRDVGYMPRRLLGADIFTWLWPVMRRATLATRIGRRMMSQMRNSGGDKRIGIPHHVLTEAGISCVGRVEEERRGLPVCDGKVIEPRVIVWCTGFAPDYRWIDLPVFGEDGYPRHERGVVADAPGLFFLGLRFQHRVSSSLIGGVGDDAEFIADTVLAREVEQAAEKV